MAARKLGGGRILGSGKGLAPPGVPPHLQQGGGVNGDGNGGRRPDGHHSRSTSLLSVAESAQSGASWQSTTDGASGRSTPLGTSPLPSQETLGERVEMGKGGGVSAVNTRLLCPICNEEMVSSAFRSVLQRHLNFSSDGMMQMTLLQLNRHLDDDHRELPEVEQDEVKNWFEKQVTKAKKFQPLVAINQKLKGLDVFESNDVLAALPIALSSNTTQQRAAEPGRQPDPDEIVTRQHWQKQGYNDVCTEPSCGKRLGTLNGNVNCRKCGRLFCEDHTMYQMKLSRAALHEPVRGFWCRCCETCYKSREGYNDHTGYTRNHTKGFESLRRPRVEKQHLEISRLEKRLSRLTGLLADPPPDLADNGGGYLSMVAGRRDDPKKALEQSVVAWEDDASVSHCPFCQQEFGTWTFRRHHCRMCGRVVCSDPRTFCSTTIPLNAHKPSGDTVDIDVRMCRDCKSTIFSRKDFDAETASKPRLQRAYENLLQFERGIRPLLASFQRTLPMLQDPDHPPTHQQISEASKVRKRLIDSFGKYDLAAKRIRDLPTESETQKRLQRNIYQQASNFLHLHMLPLKSLPKMLKHASPHGDGRTPPGPSRRGSGVGALASIRYNDSDKASEGSSVQAMEAEEKELRERLIVLEEQKFLVEEMVRDANRRRKFDEVSALAGNLEDLSREIDAIGGVLEGMDFRGAYEGVMAR